MCSFSHYVIILLLRWKHTMFIVSSSIVDANEAVGQPPIHPPNHPSIVLE